MCYAAESWPNAIDLESAVRRVACKLSDFQHDAILQQNRGFHCWDEQYLRDEEELYRRGIIICDMYLSDKIGLELFCDLLLCIKLNSFLWDLKHFLPDDIIVKYQMHDSDGNDFNIHDYLNCTGCSLGDEIRDFVFFGIPLSEEKEKEMENKE